MSDLHARAVRLLARREHTRAELARKLAPLGAPEDIQSVLDDLARSGFQSDARFAESYVRTQSDRLGTARLRQALRTRGVEGPLADACLEELPDELARCHSVWTKKFAAPPTDAREWAKQARFLQGRGFGGDIIRRVLKDIGE